MKMALFFAVVAVSSISACTGDELPEPARPARPWPDAKLQQVADQLVQSSGAPGALLGISHGGQHHLYASGSEDLLGLNPLTTERTFAAGSIAKLFTGALVMRAVERNQLALDAPLSRWLPTFPNARDITIDALLSHTAGVTTRFFEDPTIMQTLLVDGAHAWTADEVIALLDESPPAGAPDTSGMQYSNLDFVLLSKVLTEVTAKPFEQQLRDELFMPLALSNTTFPFARESALHGTFELNGAALDTSFLPNTALMSFAGAAGALHSSVDDLLVFGDALFRDRTVLSEASLAHLQTAAAPGSWYAHAMMRGCPCSGEGDATQYTGLGHGGHMPGFWSLLMHYPERDVTIVLVINRDSVNGHALDRDVFDPSLVSVLSALE